VNTKCTALGVLGYQLHIKGCMHETFVQRYVHFFYALEYLGKM